MSKKEVIKFCFLGSTTTPTLFSVTHFDTLVLELHIANIFAPATA